MSIVRSITRSITKPIVSDLFGTTSLSRYFLDFDPVLNSYGELGSAWTASGDFEIEVEFATTSTGFPVMIGGTLASSDAIILRTSATGVDFFAFVGGSLQAIVSVIIPVDGKFHSAKARYVGTTAYLSVDGGTEISQTWALNGSQDVFRVGARGASAYFDGTIANVKLTDLDSPANSLEFNLGEPTSAYELPVNNVLGSELVTNGTFDSDVTGWYSFQSGILSSVGGKLRVTNGVIGQRGRAVTSLGVLSGNYILSQATPSGTASAFYTYITTSASGSTTGIVGSESFDAESVPYNLPSATYYLVVGNNDATNSATGDFDNISVKQVSNALTYNNIPSTNRWLATQVGSDWVGAELVVNGGFDSDLSGWTIINTDGTHTATWESGALRYISGTLSPNLVLRQASTMTVGNTYQMTAIVQNNAEALKPTNLGAASIPDGVSTITSTAISTDFDLTRTAADTDVLLDNISVKRILEQP